MEKEKWLGVVLWSSSVIWSCKVLNNLCFPHHNINPQEELVDPVHCEDWRAFQGGWSL